MGQKGGEATADSHDKDFYRKIGEKGGEARHDNNK
nr:KGG domain-containing protein [Lederbergia ruris]